MQALLRCFFIIVIGLIPKGLQKQTVRDVKRNAESRRKKEDGRSKF